MTARLVLIVFKFSQPLLINRAVLLLTEPESKSKTNIGRALIGATRLSWHCIGDRALYTQHIPVYHDVPWWSHLLGL